MRLALTCLVVAVTFSPNLAQANDTTAAIGIGGLEFTKSDDVEMLSEELFVSSERIVVKYRFRNNAREDLTTLIAFPLPEVKYDPESTYRNVDEFTTTVDGTPVELREEQNSTLRGQDQTNTLRRYGLPLDPFAAYDVISRESGGTKTKLEQLSLIDDAGNPTWTFQKSLYWEQRFPAGQEITIEHRYTPLVGGSVSTGLGLMDRDPKVRAFYDKYCVDEQFVDAAKEKAKGNSLKDHPGSFSEKWIEYVLTTGANWFGPIRKFRLVVDKGREENLVSFCGQGTRKVGLSEYEFTATDFVPEKDLNVLILEPREPPPSLPLTSTVATETESPSLDGTAWVREMLPEPAIAGSQPTVRFEGSRVYGSDGCNRYRASYTTKGSEIEIQRLGSTLMACEPAVMKRAGAFMSALTAAKRYRVSNGQLQLLAVDGSVLSGFVAQSQSLAGTSWRVAFINDDKGRVTSVVGGSALTMEFADNGEVSGSAGCNRYTATYQAEGTRLKFTLTRVTLMLCATAEVLEQEQAFLRALKTVTTMRMEADRLETRTAAGALAMTLVRNGGP
jgi:heat shock protein HslJ